MNASAPFSVIVMMSSWRMPISPWVSLSAFPGNTRGPLPGVGLRQGPFEVLDLHLIPSMDTVSRFSVL